MSSPAIGSPGSVELETRFVGRRQTVDRLLDQLDDGARLVTVTGPPGIGKTRLAREAAATADDRFDGGIWFIDLSELEAATDIISVVADRLGIPLDADEGTERTAHSLAGRRETLLILDNAEHLTGGPLVDLLTRWLGRAPQLHVMVTSRHRLGLDFETCLALPPLETSEAIDLFEARARKVDASFDVGPDNRQTVAELVDRLDRLPLAVKLAAGRIRILSPAQMLDRLERRFELLDQPTDASGRRRSLEGAIEASWESLSDAQKRTLAHCSVFRGPFTMEAAEAVVRLDAQDPPVFEIVADLVDHSLLQSTRNPQADRPVDLQMLESIRRFVVDRMRREGDWEQLRQRHADYYRSFARYTDGFVNHPDFLGWVDRLGPHVDNLRLVLDWYIPDHPEPAALVASTLADFYTYRRNRREAARVAERLLEECRLEQAPRLKAKLIYIRGVHRQRSGQNEAATPFYEEARRLAERAEAPRLLCRLCFVRGLNAYTRGRYDRADAILTEGQRLADTHGYDLARTVLLSLRGRMECELSELEAAKETLREALAVVETIEAPSQEMRVRINFGTLLQHRRRFDRALEHTRRGIEVADRADTPIAPTTDKSNLACALTLVGRHEEAAEQFELADRSLQKQGLRKAQVNSLLNYGLLLLEGEEPERATAVLRRALDNNLPNNHVGGFSNRGGIHASLAVAAARRDRFGTAERHLEQARQTLDELDSPEISRKLDTYLDQHRALVDLLESAASETSPDPEQLDRLRRRHLPGPEAPFLSFENEMSTRLLRRAIERQETSAPESPTEPTNEPDLRVGPEGRWFELPDGERLDFSRRGALRRIALAFVDRHLDAPGESLSTYELLDEGWPDVDLDPEAGSNRVYTTISRLRGLGFDDLVMTDDAGYFLDPSLTVERDDEP